MSWRNEARCAGQPLTAFFPCDRWEPGTAPYLAEVRDVREQFCWRCPVRAACLREGLTEEAGVFGGLEQIERRRVVQLDCVCGVPLDPKTLRWSHFCPNCRPVALAQ